MTTTPINLNKTRKARARTEAKARAQENAVKFGHTKGEKASDTAAAKQAQSKLDAHKRDT